MLGRSAATLFLFLFCLTVKGQVKPIQLTFEGGHISARFNSKSGEKRFTLDALIPATTTGDSTVLLSADSTGIVIRQHIRYFDHACTITNTVKKTGYGLQWDIAITGEGDDWTAPIETRLKWDDPGSLLFWTTWADNHVKPEAAGWQDPFLPAPFQNLALVYGGESHVSRDAFVIPIASSFLKDEDQGLSFIQSLTDTILDLEMHTSADGQIAYRHLNHRIGSGRTIRIRHQVVLHQGDWRAGMAWMMDNYKSYFLPEEPLVNQIAGGGAYSSYEGERIRRNTAKWVLR